MTIDEKTGRYRANGKRITNIGTFRKYTEFYLEKHPDITRLAVAFDFQILDLVPTEPTDICPQIIVTQSKVYRREDL